MAGIRSSSSSMAASDFGPFIQMPAALSYPMNMGIYDWGYTTEPEPNLGNRDWQPRAAR
jgi:hypothetical protein